jgi:type II secretory pathway predicted ATPase ExeA
MYKEFYGFTAYPFALTPDQQFVYLSENYKNCLFYLLYGLEREYGLVVLTGEIGTGKTFLLNSLVKGSIRTPMWPFSPFEIRCL